MRPSTKAKQYFTDTKDALNELVNDIKVLQESLSDRLGDPALIDHADFEPIRKASKLVAAFKRDALGKLSEIVSKADQFRVDARR